MTWIYMSAWLRSMRRRGSAALAAAGVLVMASGLVVLNAPTASAVPDGSDSVPLCHANNSDNGKPYVYEAPSADSARLQGHLGHRSDPTMSWGKDSWWNDTFYPAGTPRPDIISDYTDGAGVFHKLDGTVDQSYCEAAATIGLRTAAPAVTWTDATCQDPNPSYTAAAVVGVSYALTGSVAQGLTATVTATAQTGYQFAGGTKTATFPHSFTTLDTASCAAASTPPDPTGDPTAGDPTGDPTAGDPTGDPTAGDPTGDPTAGDPTGDPTAGDPSGDPTGDPTQSNPGDNPSSNPGGDPTGDPTGGPTGGPTGDAGNPQGTQTAAPQPHGDDNQHHRHHRHHQAANEPGGLPTAVDAGLAGGPVAAPTVHGLLGQGLVVGGLVLLLAAGWIGLGRRIRGIHQV